MATAIPTARVGKQLFIACQMAAVLMLAGCNKPNQETTQNTPQGNAAQSTDTTTQTFEPLTIALDWVPNTNHTGLYVAKDLGYFKNQGFEVNIVQPSEDSAATLVANDRADFGVYFQPNMVKRLNKGEPIEAVAAIVPHNNAGLMSLASLGVKTPKDLHGKRYSTWEDPVDDATVAAVVGEPLNKIPGESTDATTALKMNQFDYILAYYSWDGIHAGLKGEATNFFYLKDANPAFDYYSPVLIANSQKISQNPERYKKALSAIKEGYVYAAKNPEQSAEILLKNAPETNKELALASQKYMSTQYLDEAGDWGKIDQVRWDRFFAWVNDNKLTDKPLASGAGLSQTVNP